MSRSLWSSKFGWSIDANIVHFSRQPLPFQSSLMHIQRIPDSTGNYKRHLARSHGLSQSIFRRFQIVSQIRKLNQYLRLLRQSRLFLFVYAIFVSSTLSQFASALSQVILNLALRAKNIVCMKTDRALDAKYISSFGPAFPTYPPDLQGPIQSCLGRSKLGARSVHRCAGRQQLLELKRPSYL